MERPANCIDIFEFTSQFGAVEEAVALRIISNVIRTCSCLFENNIFHRDIKDENVLLNPVTLDTFIIDFGCATLPQGKQQIFSQFSGTPEFAAPEYYLTGRYDQQKKHRMERRLSPLCPPFWRHSLRKP